MRKLFSTMLLAVVVSGLPALVQAFDFVLPAGEQTVSLPFLYESERGDPDGLLLSDRPVLLRLGWDEAALAVAVEAGDEVLPGDGVSVKVGTRTFDYALDGKKSFAAKIPWTETGLKPEEGATFLFDVQRTRAKGVRGADRLAVATVTLSRTASSWRFSNPIHLGDKWFDTTFSLTARKAGDARFSFNVWGYRPLNFYINTGLSLKAGETKSVPVQGGSMDRGNLDVRVFDTDGRRLFSNVWKFRVNEPVAVRVIRTDLQNERLLLETDNRVAPDDGYRVKLTLTDYFDASKPAWTKTVPATVARGVTNEVFDVSDLKPGVYKAVSTVLTKDGRTVREYLNYYAKEDGKPEWLDAGIGEEDEVPPPWTAPVSTDTTFGCWGREHAFGGSGLVRSMKTQDRELLAGPVSVILNGKPLAFASKIVKRRTAGTDYALTAADAPVSATLSAEFDGFLWCELDWGKIAERVDSLDVVVPLRRETLGGFEIGPNGFFRILGATNAVWQVDPTQYPCWWFGDGRTGLMAGLPFVRGTHLKNVEKAVEFRAGPQGAELVMHLVDTPFKPTGDRKVGFYLEATPSHPRNNACALIPREKVTFWTGQVAHFFDASMAGMMDEKACAHFRRLQNEKGHSVYYYYSVKGTSPYQPWWGRFGQSWTRFDDPANWYNETKVKPKTDEQDKRERHNWVRTCLADRNFADHKVWTIDWLLKTPKYEAMNLYFDLAQPSPCTTESHGCVWTDDFGVKRSHWDVKEMRETNLRAYRLLKRKNPDGVIFGHSGTFRGPSDVFFDRMVRGEHYASAVSAGDSYYGVLNPEDMQIKYASRSNEYVIDMLPQIVRAMQMYGKSWKLKTYDPLETEADRAIRHATAYFKIHDLLVATAVDGRQDGPQWQVAEQCIAQLGATRAFRAYYHPDCPVSVDGPERLFLYAWYRGNGKTLVIVLNDTDAPMTKTLTVKDLKGVGRDLFKGGAADFSSGRCTVTLGPRESRFWLFETPEDETARVLHASKPNPKATPVASLPLACRAAETVPGEAPSLLPNGLDFTLVWHDEFNGTRLDESKWSYRTNFWGRRFPAYAGPEDGCVDVKNGQVHLKLKRRADGQFCSPQLQTGELMWDIPWNEARTGFWPLPKREPPKFVHRYGYYEARVRLQRRPGWWSAFWMQTETQGVCLDPARAGIEHDIMESFAPGEASWHMFHYNGYGADYRGYSIPRGASSARGDDLKLSTDEFHTFGLLWEPDGYRVFVDGRQHGEKGGTGPGEAVSQVPEFLLISTECQWYRNNRMTGTAVAELEESARLGDDFVVDYVRVYDIGGKSEK